MLILVSLPTSPWFIRSERGILYIAVRTVDIILF